MQAGKLYQVFTNFLVDEIPGWNGAIGDLEKVCWIPNKSWVMYLSSTIEAHVVWRKVLFDEKILKIRQFYLVELY